MDLSQENGATLTDTRKMAKTQIVAPRHLLKGRIDLGFETLGCHNLSLRDTQSPPRTVNGYDYRESGGAL